MDSDRKVALSETDHAVALMPVMLLGMGAWDVTAFGNDDAADWASELVDAGNPIGFVEITLGLAQRDGYLEALDGSQLIAAAAVVAAAVSGNVPGGFPESLNQWLGGKEGSLKGFAAVAKTAVQRVRGTDSELRDLWEATEDFSAWNADLEAISTALR